MSFTTRPAYLEPGYWGPEALEWGNVPMDTREDVPLSSQRTSGSLGGLGSLGSLGQATQGFQAARTSQPRPASPRLASSRSGTFGSLSGLSSLSSLGTQYSAGSTGAFGAARPASPRLSSGRSGSFGTAGFTAGVTQPRATSPRSSLRSSGRSFLPSSGFGATSSTQTPFGSFASGTTARPARTRASRWDQRV